LIVAIVISYEIGRYRQQSFPSPGPIPPTPIPPTPIPPTPIPTKPYLKYKTWTGIQMIDSGDFRYFTGLDPTRGLVKYTNDQSLIKKYDDNSVDINVGSVPIDVQVDYGGGNIQIKKGRAAIRLESKEQFSKGLFIINVSSVPIGPAVWPSWWLLGEGNWACKGEIDIIEYVNSDKRYNGMKGNIYNAVTRHTTTPPGLQPCRSANGWDCTAGNPDFICKNCSGGKVTCPTYGCGTTMTYPSAGYAINEAGGAVFACLLDSEGDTKVWSWLKNDPKLPSDFRNGIPNSLDPKEWDKQIKFFACPGQFRDMYLVLNTTLCGDWAGNTFNLNNPSPGLPQECERYVANSDNKFIDAKWNVNWMGVYQI